MRPSRPPLRPGRVALLGALGIGLGFSLACTAQLKLIEEQTICDEVGYAIAARVHACTGDEDLAMAHHRAFTQGYSCRTGWFETFDIVEDAYSCATTISALDCDTAAELGTDIGAWLALDEDCDTILQEGPATSTGGGEGSGGEGSGGEGTGGGTGGEGTGGGTGGEGTGGEGTGGGTGGSDDPVIRGRILNVDGTEGIGSMYVNLSEYPNASLDTYALAESDGSYEIEGYIENTRRVLYVGGGNYLGTWVHIDLEEGLRDGMDLRGFNAFALNVAENTSGIPKSGGYVAAHAVDESGAALSGVQFSLTPTPDASTLMYYVSESEGYDFEATATLASGAALFYSTTPGTYAVGATHGSRTCTPLPGWATDDGVTAWVQPESGYVHSATFVCVP